MRTLKNIVLVGWLPMAVLAFWVYMMGVKTTGYMLGVGVLFMAIAGLYALGLGRVSRE